VAGAAPQIRVGTLVELERRFDRYDVADGLRDHVAFNADVVIIALGENVPDLGTPQAKAGYRAAFARLLAELKRDNHPAIFVRSSFWPNVAKDEIMKKVCAEAGGVFVDIAALAAENANYARSERKIDHAGVGAHPGDRGMQAIADAIWTAITKRGEASTQQD
jgi:lysophospholipase L1-like esterase